MRKFSLINESNKRIDKVELHYYKHTKEDVNYKTWKFDDDTMQRDYGWEKLEGPSYLDISETAKQWYKDSNNEDLIFITKELEACKEWFKLIKDDIYVAQSYNRK